ncbi:TCF3 fusion partner homolog [Chiloscyllium punctatum]
MAAVGFDDFPGPCSELALPPLFGGNILASELEQEVEFTDSGLHEGRGREEEEVQDEEEEGDEEEDEEQVLRRRREAYRPKYHALLRRCKEIELVNEMLLNRLECVGKITQRLKQERRFLMRCLDSHGDEYRTAQLTIVLEDEGSQGDTHPRESHCKEIPTTAKESSPARPSLRSWPAPQPGMGPALREGS